MIRFLACIGIIASSTTFALFASSSLKKRVKQLSELSRMFLFVKNEIKIFNSTIPNIFEKVSFLTNDECGKIFARTNIVLSENPGIGLESAWKEAVIESAFFLSMNAEDIEIIKSFGAMLEKNDTDGQIRNIGYIISKLSYQEHRAVDNKIRNERLINSAGLLSGIAVSILLY